MQIASITNPVLRNLRITECYHRLSVAMAQRIGQSANWCTFATWASKQAGQTIRGEDILDRLDTKSKETQKLLHPIHHVRRKNKPDTSAIFGITAPNQDALLRHAADPAQRGCRRNGGGNTQA